MVEKSRPHAVQEAEDALRFGVQERGSASQPCGWILVGLERRRVTSRNQSLLCCAVSFEGNDLASLLQKEFKPKQILEFVSLLQEMLIVMVKVM